VLDLIDELGEDIRREIADARDTAAVARCADASAEKIAPEQGYTAEIPWSPHLEAHDVYCEHYVAQAIAFHEVAH
jgi:hypothetical protein